MDQGQRDSRHQSTGTTTSRSRPLDMWNSRCHFLQANSSAHVFLNTPKETSRQANRVNNLCAPQGAISALVLCFCQRCLRVLFGLAPGARSSIENGAEPLRMASIRENTMRENINNQISISSPLSSLFPLHYHLELSRSLSLTNDGQVLLQIQGLR